MEIICLRSLQESKSQTLWIVTPVENDPTIEVLIDTLLGVGTLK